MKNTHDFDATVDGGFDEEEAEAEDCFDDDDADDDVFPHLLRM